MSKSVVFEIKGTDGILGTTFDLSLLQQASSLATSDPETQQASECCATLIGPAPDLAEYANLLSMVDALTFVCVSGAVIQKALTIAKRVRSVRFEYCTLPDTLDFARRVNVSIRYCSNISTCLSILSIGSLEIECPAIEWLDLRNQYNALSIFLGKGLGPLSRGFEVAQCDMELTAHMFPNLKHIGLADLSVEAELLLSVMTSAARSISLRNLDIRDASKLSTTTLFDVEWLEIALTGDLYEAFSALSRSLRALNTMTVLTSNLDALLLERIMKLPRIRNLDISSCDVGDLPSLVCESVERLTIPSLSKDTQLRIRQCFPNASITIVR